MKALATILITIFLLANLNPVKAETLLDYDGDGKSDFVSLRNNNSTMDWYIHQSSTGAWYVQPWGIAWENTIPADFDGDNKTDVAIWRLSHTPGQSAFYILNSSNNTVRIEFMGEHGDLLNVFGDYDGDGKADPVVYRRAHIPAGNRYIYRGSLNNPGGTDTTVFWGNGMHFYPYRGDFDGDGKYDFCLRNYDNATFSLKRSSDGGTELITFGKTDDTIIPGDFDGDGKSDFCVRRPGKQNKYNWHIKERDGGGTGLNPIAWGNSTDFTSPYGSGDFDGDGKSDVGLYTILENIFRIRRSSNGTTLTFQWGTFGDNSVGIN